MSKVTSNEKCNLNSHIGLCSVNQETKSTLLALEMAEAQFRCTILSPTNILHLVGKPILKGHYQSLKWRDPKTIVHISKRTVLDSPHELLIFRSFKLSAANYVVYENNNVRCKHHFTILFQKFQKFYRFVFHKI